MTQNEIKTLVEDLRLNHEFCPKEVILQAANELERLSQRTWVGLTEVELDAIYAGNEGTRTRRQIYQAIEAKLKEKNT
jgi:hypothetical protein